MARLDAKIHGYFYLWERCDSLLRTPQLRRIARCSAGALAPILNVRGHSKSSFCEVCFGPDSGCLPGESAGTKRKICTTLETLIATRGPDFPLSRLESRLMCPACGNRRVTVVFDPQATRKWGLGRGPSITHPRA